MAFPLKPKVAAARIEAQKALDELKRAQTNASKATQADKKFVPLWQLDKTATRLAKVRAILNPEFELETAVQESLTQKHKELRAMQQKTEVAFEDKEVERRILASQGQAQSARWADLANALQVLAQGQDLHAKQLAITLEQTPLPKWKGRQDAVPVPGPDTTSNTREQAQEKSHALLDDSERALRKSHISRSVTLALLDSGKASSAQGQVLVEQANASLDSSYAETKWSEALQRRSAQQDASVAESLKEGRELLRRFREQHPELNLKPTPANFRGASFSGDSACGAGWRMAQSAPDEFAN